MILLSMVMTVALHPLTTLTQVQRARGPLLPHHLLYRYRPIWIAGCPRREVVNTGVSLSEINTIVIALFRSKENSYNMFDYFYMDKRDSGKTK